MRRPDQLQKLAQSNPNQKTKMGPGLKKLFKYLRPYRILIVLSVIMAIAASTFTIIGPKQIEKIVEYIQEGIFKNTEIDLKAITSIGIMLISLYLAGVVFNTAQGFIMAKVNQKATKNLREKLGNKINKLPLSYFDKTTHGDVLSRVTNDIDTMGQALNQSIGTLISSATLFVGSLIMMFVTNWILAFVALGTTIFGFFAMTLMIKSSQKYFIGQQESLGQLNGQIEEGYTGHNVIKAYNAESKFKATFSTMNSRLFTQNWKSQFFSGMMMPVMMFVGNFGYVAVSVIGAVLARNGDISIGTIAAFMIYIRLFSQPLSQVAQGMQQLQGGAAASERIFSFLDEKEMDNEEFKTKQLENIKGNVEFKNVKFGYLEDKEIIHDFSAKVKAGQKIAIVGPTGAGKTTIVNLLMRFYETTKGDILVDDVSLKDLRREKVHDIFTMVLQDTWLIEGTVRENIIFNQKNVTEDRLIEVCEKTGIHHFITSLSNGYDTQISDDDSLSVGQKQLITIARALIKNSPLLILDEATSSVDTRTELLIQNAMDELMKNKTSFVIAHRLSTIKNADVILVMKGGDVIEQGNHDELMKQNGFYANLYNSQFAE